MSKKKPLTAFEQAVIDSILVEYQDLPEENELEIDFSTHFQIWSHRLIHKTRNPYWYYVNTTAKKIILVAVILSMLTMTALAVPAIREAIIDFFFHNQGERYGITFNPEEAATAPDEIEETLFPVYIPRGYSLLEMISTPTSCFGFWTDSPGNRICYTQDIIQHNASSDNWIGIDAENVTRTTQIIGEYLVEIVRYDESYCLYWTDNSYIYSLELPNSISEEVMIEIFSSIRPIDQDVNQSGG